MLKEERLARSGEKGKVSREAAEKEERLAAERRREQREAAEKEERLAGERLRKRKG
jgi:hypothetical protein